jgi:hypothetical protein
MHSRPLVTSGRKVFVFSGTLFAIDSTKPLAGNAALVGDL